MTLTLIDGEGSNNFENIISESEGTFSGLGQFLATESSLQMVKNAFYFTLKAPFVLNIFKFLS